MLTWIIHKKEYFFYSSNADIGQHLVFLLKRNKSQTIKPGDKNKEMKKTVDGLFLPYCNGTISLLWNFSAMDMIIQRDFFHMHIFYYSLLIFIPWGGEADNLMNYYFVIMPRNISPVSQPLISSAWYIWVLNLKCKKICR